MSAEEMRLASEILGNQAINAPNIDPDDFEKLYVTDSEEDSSIETDRSNHQQKLENLLYNESDDDVNRNTSTHRLVSQEFSSQHIRGRLVELENSDDSENEKGN